MRAHIIHDRDGQIKSVVFEGTELEGGELEIPSDEDELVTVFDLGEIPPEIKGNHLSMARDIQRGYRVEVETRTLKRTEVGEPESPGS